VLDLLSDGLLALAARMDPSEAAVLCGKAGRLVLRMMENPEEPDALGRLAGSLSALVAQRGVPDAVAACAKGTALLVTALEKTTATATITRFWGLADGLESLAPRMGRSEVLPAVKAVVRAMARTTDTKAHDRLSKALTALVAQLDVQDAALAATDLLNSHCHTDPKAVAVLATRELQTLLGRENPDATRRRLLVAAGAAAGLSIPVTRFTAGVLLQPAYPPVPPPLPAQRLVDLLKHPFCVGEVRRVVLAQLSRHYRRPFADQWEFVAFATGQKLGLDLTSPVRRVGR
jgi:hypothetical protein